MVCGGRWRPAPGRYEYRAGKCSRTPGRHPAVELKKPGKLAGLLRFQGTEAVEAIKPWRYALDQRRNLRDFHCVSRLPQVVRSLGYKRERNGLSVTDA